MSTKILKIILQRQFNNELDKIHLEVIAQKWGNLLLVILSWSCWFRPSNWSIRWFKRLFSSRCDILLFSRFRFA